MNVPIVNDSDEQMITPVETKPVDSNESNAITTTNPKPETIGFETESEEISITACNSEIESSVQSTEDNLDSLAKVNVPSEIISKDEVAPHLEICDTDESKMEVEVDNTLTVEAAVTQDSADTTVEQNEVVTIVESNPIAEECHQTTENDSQATETVKPEITSIVDQSSSDGNDSKEDVAIAALMSLGRSDVSTTEYFYESKAEDVNNPKHKKYCFESCYKVKMKYLFLKC